MEIVKFKSCAIENFLEITPEKGWKDNSVYEITLKNIKDDAGNIINKKITFYTKLSPIFSDINAVKSLMSSIDIDDSTILYNIREASKYAEYICGYKIDEDNIPYEVSQFVKYRAAHECLLNFSVQQTSTTGLSGKVGDVTFSEKENNGDMTKLLGMYALEVAKWMDAVKGYHNEGRAKMQTTVKSGFFPKKMYNSSPVVFNRGIDRYGQ